MGGTGLMRAQVLASAKPHCGRLLQHPRTGGMVPSCGFSCRPSVGSSMAGQMLGAGRRKLAAASAVATCRRGSRRPVVVRAMVNVDFASPSLVLGVLLIGCGVLLLQMRNLQTKVSRDADIVVAAMISIVGSTLIFQGWRLDPLLLLCQALTTSVAVWYGIETFRLRSREEDLENLPGDSMLPPPETPAPGMTWGSMMQPQQPQQGQSPPQPGYYLPQNQQQPYPGQVYQEPMQQQQQMQQMQPQQPAAQPRPFNFLTTMFAGSGQPAQGAQAAQQGPPTTGNRYLPSGQDQTYPWGGLPRGMGMGMGMGQQPEMAPYEQGQARGDRLYPEQSVGWQTGDQDQEPSGAYQAGYEQYQQPGTQQQQQGPAETDQGGAQGAYPGGDPYYDSNPSRQYSEGQYDGGQYESGYGMEQPQEASPQPVPPSSSQQARAPVPSRLSWRAPEPIDDWE